MRPGCRDGGLSRDTADAGGAVRHWLEAGGDRRLLVFDGAEDLAALQPFLPAYGAARVLITAGRPVLASPGISVPVDVATPEEAAAFLAGPTGLTDGEGAAAVAAELGHLPLALTQAATVIAALHLTYPAYLERLRNVPAGEDPARPRTRLRRIRPAPCGRYRWPWTQPGPPTLPG